MTPALRRVSLRRGRSATSQSLTPEEERLRKTLRRNAPLFAVFGAYWALDTVFKAEGLGAPIAVNAVAKDAVLVALALTAAADLRRFAANVAFLILAHVAIVLGLATVLLVDLFSPSFTTRDTLWIPFLNDDFSTLALGVWLVIATSTVFRLSSRHRSALRARFGLRFLWPTSYRTLIALAEALVVGPHKKVSPSEIARNVDNYLADLDSKGKAQMQTALIGLYLYPMPRRGVPLTVLSPDDRARLLQEQFPRTFSTSSFRWIRMWVQAMIRAGQQLVFAGYYGDPKSYESTGYKPFSVRRPKDAEKKRGPTGLRTLHPSQLPKRADVVVIGSGAGGSIVAHELIWRGVDVLMLERGRHVEPSSFSEREVEQLSNLYSDGGLQMSRDFRLALLQGMCLGGSTVVNNAVAFDLPERVKGRWADPADLNTGLCMRRLDESFRAIRRLLQVRDQDHRRRNPGATLFRQGATELGLGRCVHSVAANIRECLGCGYCNIGCAYGRKLSMLDKVLPEAQKMNGSANSTAGELTIACECFVERIEPQGDDVRVVCGDGNGLEVDVVAERVVVAAGAIGSSQILRRSGITNDLIGERLSFNITTPMTADFGDKKRLNSYAGLQISDYLDRGEDYGYVLETWFNPVLTQSLVMPGWFRDHFENMCRYSQMTCGGVLVGAEAHGSLREERFGGRPVKFRPSERDYAVIVKGMKLLGKIFLEAKADRVMPTTFRYEQFYRGSNFDRLDRYVTRNSDLYLGSVHPQGGNVMCRDPSEGVVDEHFRLHGTENVYVCDASVFPSAVGVNPQLTVMALAHYAARCINGEDVHAPGCGCATAASA